MTDRTMFKCLLRYLFSPTLALMLATPVSAQQARISVDDAESDEDGACVFVVTSDNPSDTGTASVDYATVDGTAIAGADYMAERGSLSIVRTSARPVLVSTIDDAAPESTETFELVLSNPSSNATIAPPGRATCTSRTTIPTVTATA